MDVYPVFYFFIFTLFYFFIINLLALVSHFVQLVYLVLSFKAKVKNNNNDNAAISCIHKTLHFKVPL